MPVAALTVTGNDITQADTRTPPRPVRRTDSVMLKLSVYSFSLLGVLSFRIFMINRE